MLRQMTWRDLGEWAAFAEIEPFDERRADLRTASVVKAISDVWEAWKQAQKRRPGTPKVRPVDQFALPFGDIPPPAKVVKRERQTWQQQKEIFKMFAAAFNTADPKPKRPARRAP